MATHGGRGRLIARWTANEGGQNRGNDTLFLSELADEEILAVAAVAPMDTPADLDTELGAVFASLHRVGLAWSDDGRTRRLRSAA